MTKNCDYPENEGYSLLGAAFEVYKELGCGLAEEIYQESLELELGWRSIHFSPKSVEWKRYILSEYIPN